MDVHLLSVAQIRIYPTDAIPIYELVLARTIQAIQERYSFGAFQPGVEGVLPVVNFAFGEFTSGTSRTQIKSLLIEARKIVVGLIGDSNAADEFLADLSTFIVEITRADANHFVESVKGEETTCVAKLDLDIRSLVDERLLRIVDDTIGPGLDLGGERIPARAGRLAIKIPIEYLPSEEWRAKSQFEITDKVFVIEPRTGTDPDERIYFTKSPLSSTAHLALVERIEKAFAPRA